MVQGLSHAHTKALACSDIHCYRAGVNTTYITRKEAAHLAGVNLRTIDRWLDNGTLHREHTATGRVRIQRTQVEQIITPRAGTDDR